MKKPFTRYRATLPSGKVMAKGSYRCHLPEAWMLIAEFPKHGIVSAVGVYEEQHDNPRSTVTRKTSWVRCQRVASNTDPVTLTLSREEMEIVLNALDAKREASVYQEEFDALEKLARKLRAK